MAEETEQSKYIIGSKCKCRYLNLEECVIRQFGYKSLVERYKTCKHCREICKINNIRYIKNHPEKRKEHYEAHKEERKEYYETHKEEVKECVKQYRKNNADKIRAYDRERNKIKTHCPKCNAEVIKIFKQSSTIAKVHR